MFMCVCVCVCFDSFLATRFLKVSELIRLHPFYISICPIDMTILGVTIPG